MARPRFTLAQLLAAVVFIGLGLAALRSASLFWASAVFSLTVALLSTAVLVVMARRGRARMTWLGFALFGWIYLGTTFGPWSDTNGVKAPPYVTRLAVDYWDARFWRINGGTGTVLWRDTAPPGEMLVSRFAASPTLPDSFQVRRIGHCLAAILVGLGGAVIGRLVANDKERFGVGAQPN
jgi:hypothetical protein